MTLSIERKRFLVLALGLLALLAAPHMATAQTLPAY